MLLLVPASQDTFFMNHIIYAHKLTVFFLIQWHTLPYKSRHLRLSKKNLQLAEAIFKLISHLFIVLRKKYTNTNKTLFILAQKFFLTFSFFPFRLGKLFSNATNTNKTLFILVQKFFLTFSFLTICSC